MSEIVLTIEGVEAADLFGQNNQNLDLIKENYPDVTFTGRGNLLKLKGEKKYTQAAKQKIELLVKMLKDKHTLTKQSVEDILQNHNAFDNKLPEMTSGGTIVFGRGGKPIKAKTKNQKKLVEMSDKNDIVFAIGPAGTGKTYVAVALAVKALKSRLVKKIILTRPAVEAGESLGFLPGDLKDKVDPYLRPLYDALDDLLPTEKLNFFMTNRVIEVAPLAFMRGRTLDNAFIILDEAQNCTTGQLKMFLTRLGPSAKCIITGDLSQIDLPGHQKSGLYRALDILGNVRGIGKLFLDADDVVRHRLVKEIIIRYDQSDRQRTEEKYGKYKQSINDKTEEE